VPLDVPCLGGKQGQIGQITDGNLRLAGREILEILLWKDGELVYEENNLSTVGIYLVFTHYHFPGSVFGSR